MPSHYKKSSPSSSTSGSFPGRKGCRPFEPPISYEEIVRSGSDKPPAITLDERIVWLSDNGPEYGVVKWLGKLPSECDEWMAGVHFDHAVGTGSGDYNNFKLFDTPFEHASLVPIFGLIKASDYSPENNLDSEQHRHQHHHSENPLPARPPRKQQKVKPETFKFYAHPSPKTSKDEKILTEKRDLSEDFLEKNGDRLSPKSAIDVPFYKVDMEQADDSRYLQTNRPLRIKTDDLFEVGSMVEFEHDNHNYHGVVRWLGIIQAAEEELAIVSGSPKEYRKVRKESEDTALECCRKSDKNADMITAGIEIDDEEIGFGDGKFNDKRYFNCPRNKSIFVPLLRCSKDDRFASSIASSSISNFNGFEDSFVRDSGSGTSSESKYFGNIDCPVVMGNVDSITTRDGFEKLLGKNRAIQGHHNSCYLDATLFSMFASVTVFDSLLNRPQSSKDIGEYSEVQKVLKEEIVNPLRANYYVRADRVMKFRHLLEKISSMRGLTTEEKDPEEFLDMLLAEVLKTEPYLKFSTGLNSFCYQLFVEKDDSIELPNVQQLFEQSFFSSKLKLTEIPPCLILQMPRFGRQFKTYPRIMPTLYLDITNVLDNSPRQCTICGDLAEYECDDCFGIHDDGLEAVAHCAKCLKLTHTTKNKNDKHKYSALKVPENFRQLNPHPKIPRVMMQLFAVLCIETSHYVSFVKCGSQSNSPWCFFDSMADRKGGQNGYNIPEVRAFSEIDWWLGNDGIDFLKKNKDDKVLPEFPRRLFSDAYICFYSSDVQRYR